MADGKEEGKEGGVSATGLSAKAEIELAQHAALALERLDKVLTGQSRMDFTEVVAYLNAIGRGYTKARADVSILLRYIGDKGKGEDFAQWVKSLAKKATGGVKKDGKA